ncbi:MAG: cadherin-like domain-containing protein [Chloroflexota bacterium]
MLKRVSLLLLMVLAVLFLQIQTPPDVAHSLIWAKKNQLYANTSAVCRDGAVMTVTYFNYDGEDSDEGDGWVDYLGARLFTAEYGWPQELDSEFGLSGRLYGPRLANIKEFVVEYHNGEPFPADLDRDGTKEHNFYVYKTDTLLWSRLLDVGEVVLFTAGDNPMYALPVADCYLNSFDVNSGETAVIDDSQLNTGFGIMPNNAILYHIDSLPTEGTLMLNSVPLNVGDTFSQTQLNNGEVSYVHGGNSILNDSFDFTVQGTRRVSVSTAGVQSNGNSYSPSISGDGARVAYHSYATNLVNRATNAFANIYFTDISLKETERISDDYLGGVSNNGSIYPAMSPDGGHIAFQSTASDLVGTDPGGCRDQLDTNGFSDIFVFNIANGNMDRASLESEAFSTCDESNGNSYSADIGEDGIDVTYSSYATNLSGPDTDADSDIFTTAGLSANFTQRVTDSVINNHSFWPDISDDGEVVAFQSSASNLVADSNGASDIFVEENDTIERVSVRSNGAQANGGSFTPSLSEDGRFVAYSSEATNLVDDDNNSATDIFVHDRETNVTTRVSISSQGVEGDGNSFSPEISGNGRYITFYSYATNLVSNDTNGKSDIFMHDRITGETIRVSVGFDGGQGDHATKTGAGAFWPTISDDGDYIAYYSDFDDLVENDTNDTNDIFLHYRGYSSTFMITIEESTAYLPLVIR